MPDLLGLPGLSDHPQTEVGGLLRVLLLRGPPLSNRTADLIELSAVEPDAVQEFLEAGVVAQVAPPAIDIHVRNTRCLVLQRLL